MYSSSAFDILRLVDDRTMLLELSRNIVVVTARWTRAIPPNRPARRQMAILGHAIENPPTRGMAALELLCASIGTRPVCEQRSEWSREVETRLSTPWGVSQTYRSLSFPTTEHAFLTRLSTKEKYSNKPSRHVS